MKICLLSDTHHHLDDGIRTHLDWADEIWHAGDIGNAGLLDELEKFCTTRAVWGNIDGADLRVRLPELNSFEVDGLKVSIFHIGGHPPRYNAVSAKILDELRPDIFIAGHSHILKVMRDQDRKLIYMNPGAAGQHGFHKIRTLLRFNIEEGVLKNLEVVELGKRGKI